MEGVGDGSINRLWPTELLLKMMPLFKESFLLLLLLVCSSHTKRAVNSKHTLGTGLRILDSRLGTINGCFSYFLVLKGKVVVNKV